MKEFFFNLIIVIVLLAAIGILHHSNVVFFRWLRFQSQVGDSICRLTVGSGTKVLEVTVLWTVYVLIVINGGRRGRTGDFILYGGEPNPFPGFSEQLAAVRAGLPSRSTLDSLKPCRKSEIVKL